MFIQNSSYPKPLPISVFCGIGKPSIEQFLDNLVTELKNLTSNYFCFQSHYYKIAKVIFICDAPARSYLQCIKGHSAKLGCGYCRVEGVYLEDRVCFSYNDSIEMRCNDFYCNIQENNQIRPSPLLHVVDLVYDFPPEYLHSVCLGVVKKLCTYFFTYVRGLKLPCRLSVAQKDEMSSTILHIRKFLPKEFHRKLRSLKEFEHYKAVEFRAILIYLGPFLFKKYLPSDFFNHFLLLHFSVYVFCSPIHSERYFSQAEMCIEKFCYEADILYKNKLSSYNTHIIRHIPKFVQLYGILDNWSSFRFENYLSILKRRLKCTNGIFAQTVNNLFLIRDLFSNISSHDVFFNCSSPDNCAVLSCGTIILIMEVNYYENIIFVSGYKMRFIKSLYSYPYESQCLSIGYYTKSDTILSLVKPVLKCICIPLDNNQYICIPFVNMNLCSM
ncbi:UNVERIFIED_CONTAM: hypothetical protein GTU68_014635 [Idotea baltica]|nr:hypothetical protein [Idotea baltica]